MENYIVLNGKRTELTEQQLKELGLIMERKNPFERNGYKKTYYFIDSTEEIVATSDHRHFPDNLRYNTANYCTDKELLQQQAYREILNRLLWRYSMEHDGDKIDWNDNDSWKWNIVYSYNLKKFDVGCYYCVKHSGCVYFYTAETAKNAIEEIVKPFMKEHPDFKW